MVAREVNQEQDHRRHLRLVLTGEAGDYVDALDRIVGPGLIETYRVRRPAEMLELVRVGVPDAVVIDPEGVHVDALKLLRTIRQVNQGLLVVLLTGRMDRRLLEEALRLAAFSVLAKPLQLEQLLVQVHRMMIRMNIALRHGGL